MFERVAHVCFTCLPLLKVAGYRSPSPSHQYALLACLSPDGRLLRAYALKGAHRRRETRADVQGTFPDLYCLVRL